MVHVHGKSKPTCPSVQTNLTQYILHDVLWTRSKSGQTAHAHNRLMVKSILSHLLLIYHSVIGWEPCELPTRNRGRPRSVSVLEQTFRGVSILTWCGIYNSCTQIASSTAYLLRRILASVIAIVTLVAFVWTNRPSDQYQRKWNRVLIKGDIAW